MLSSLVKSFGSYNSKLFKYQSKNASRFFSTEAKSNAEDKWFLLEYTYVDNMLTKRVPHRQAHLEVAKEAIEKGNLILGGAHSDTKLATIVFKAKDASVVKSFAENDPYVKEGLVTILKHYMDRFLDAQTNTVLEWEVKEWAVVVGNPSIFNNQLIKINK